MLDVIIDLVTEYKCDGPCPTEVDIVIASRLDGGLGGCLRTIQALGTTDPRKKE